MATIEGDEAAEESDDLSRAMRKDFERGGYAVHRGETQEWDLVIAVDGMAAHLAGGLRRPVWMLLDGEADWRWMDEGAGSPWYPPMRIFRLAARPGWADVAGQVRAALSSWAAKPR